MDTLTTKRIADASAITALATMAMTWLIPKGIGMLVSGGFSGFELMSRFFPQLMLVPLSALLCLAVLIYSEVNPTDYARQNKRLALLRGACAVAGFAPVLHFAYSVMSYDPVQNQDLWGMAIPMDLGEGPWLALIAFLVIGAEAFADYARPT